MLNGAVAVSDANSDQVVEIAVRKTFHIEIDRRPIDFLIRHVDGMNLVFANRERSKRMMIFLSAGLLVAASPAWAEDAEVGRCCLCSALKRPMMLLLGRVQVADRWHLMENASRAFLDAVRKSMRQVRSVIGATRIDPELLTAAERIQYEGYLRREETNAAILELSKSGMAIKQIARQTGHSRKLVRQVVRGERNDVFRTRQSYRDPSIGITVRLPFVASDQRDGRTAPR
jgi:hypothetical protein